MKEKTQTKGSAISGLFTMLLFLVFVLCALFSVLMGSRVYENIIKRSDANFSGTTAISYIANKIRQVTEKECGYNRSRRYFCFTAKTAGWGENTTHGSTGKMDRSGNCLQMKTAVWVWMTALERYWNAPVFLWKKRKNTITLQTLGEGAAGLKLSLRSGGKDANEQK